MDDYKVNFVTLFNRLAIDFDLDFPTRTYISRRLVTEGIVVWTSVLPTLAKTVILGLELGSFVAARTQLGFTAIAWKGGLLKYFRGFLTKIFSKNGELLADPCPKAIYSLRQICEYVYKLALPFDDEQLARAEENFVEVDGEVATAPLDESFIDRLRKDFLNYHKDISYAKLDNVFKSHSPRPGPGTFSTTYIKGNRHSIVESLRYGHISMCQTEARATQRGFFTRRGIFHVVDSSLPHTYKPYPGLPKRLLSRYKYDFGVGPKYILRPGTRQYHFIRPVHFCSSTKDVSSLVIPCSEVLFVPKDSRGPRTIVREPYDLLIHQMAYFDWITDRITKNTYGRVQFRDQSLNRKLAREGSITGEWATLDLKEASDRVSLAVVQRLFENSPACRAFLKRYRTEIAKLPSGGVVRLAKLAGMGSGLTFSTMALLIHLVVSREICDATGKPYSACQKLVYVYGDDIVLPSKYAGRAAAALSRVGLKVNASKSFANGRFRESCGGDYFNGVEVTPVRLRLANCDLELNGNNLVVSGSFDTLAIERHCRELVKAGLFSTAEMFYQLLERRIGGRLPTVSGNSPVIGRYSETPPMVSTDACGNYMNVRVLTAVPSKEKGFECCYVRLGRNLRPSQETWQFFGSKRISLPQGTFETPWESFPTSLIEPEPMNNPLGIFDVPRSVQYRWRNVSAALLM